jgi:hypothetical protein
MIAYIDPGAGSFALQAIVAAVAGTAYALRSRLKRLRALFGPRRPPDPEPARESAADPGSGARRGDG